MLQNLPIMFLEFLAHYSQNYAHSFCKGGYSIRINNPSIKVGDCFTRVIFYACTHYSIVALAHSLIFMDVSR